MSLPLLERTTPDGLTFALTRRTSAGLALHERIPLLTGVVGAAGALGGFFSPWILRAVRELIGSHALVLFGCAGAFVTGTVVLLELVARWSLRWDLQAVRQAVVYSYRSALLGADTERAA